MKETVIYLRCSEETKKRLKLVRDKYGFKDYEDTLRYLLDLIESYPPPKAI